MLGTALARCGLFVSQRAFSTRELPSVSLSVEECTTALGYIAALSEEKRKPIRTVLLKAYLLAGVEKQLAKLEMDKASQLAKLEMDKADLKTSHDRKLADLKASHDRELAMLKLVLESKDQVLANAQAELLKMKAKVSSVYAFRPIIELSCSKWSKGSNLGASVKAYIAKHVQPGLVADTPGDDLSEESKRVLQSLGVTNPDLHKEIALNVSQLHSKLCEPPYQPPSGTWHQHGFLLGGDPPLRYAIALVILKLQSNPREKWFPRAVILLDSSDNPTHVLLNGRAVLYDPNESYQ